jgi:hypothetical protein
MIPSSAPSQIARHPAHRDYLRTCLQNTPAILEELPESGLHDGPPGAPARAHPCFHDPSSGVHGTTATPAFPAPVMIWSIMLLRYFH